jgi:hypothetical protein
MDWSCRKHGRDEKCIQSFGHKPEGRDLLEDLGVEGRVLGLLN